MTTESYSDTSMETAYREPRWPRGWRSYLALISGFLMMFNCWGLIMAFGNFLRLYEKHVLTRTPKLQLSLIGGVQIFPILALAPITGRLLDAHSHYWLGFVGSLLMFTGYFALSFSSKGGLENPGNYWAIMFTTAVAGLGQACVFIYSPQNVAQWFPHRKSIAIGIASAGAAAGGLGYPLSLKFLVARFGFSVGVRILSAIVGSVGLFAAMTGGPTPTVAPCRINPAWKAATWFDRAAWKNAAFLWYAASLAFVHLGFFAFPFYVTFWTSNKARGFLAETTGITDKSPSNTEFHTLWLISIMNASSMAGRISSGFLANLFRPITIQASSCALAGFICICWWPLTPNVAAAISFSAMYGILSGSVAGLLASGIADIVPAARETSLGQWLGMVLALGALPALAGPVITGAIFDQFGEDAVGFWTGSLLITASFCQVVTLHKMHGGEERMERGSKTERDA